MYLLFVLFFILLLVYYKINKWSNFWKDRNVPCSRSIPLIGHVGKMIMGKQSFFDFTVETYNQFPGKRYNGVFHFLKPVLIIRDLNLIKQICIKDFDYFTDHLPFGTEKSDKVLYVSLFNLKGQAWKEMRCTLSPAFTSLKMRGMFLFMCENSDNLVRYLQNKKQEIVEEEARNIFYKSSIDVIMSAVFGINPNTFENPKNEFYEMATTAVKHQAGFQLTLSQIAPKLYEFLGCKIFSDVVVDFFSNLVRDNMQQREKYNIIRPDMIHLLMEAQKGRLKYETVAGEADTGFATAQESELGKSETCKKATLTHDDVVAQALVLLLAGADTITTVGSFMAYELALNPDIQRKLQAEISETLEKCHGKITYEELLSMKFLDQVLSETMRKWTSAFHMERICVRDYKIPSKTSDEPDLVIEKGQEIIVPLAGIHRDPSYFPDPLKFDPDRFSDKNKSKIVPGTFMPFGIGPRNCIGSRFALLELKTLFFHLLHKFDIVTVKKTETNLQLDPKQFTVTPKNGLWLGFRARD